MTYDKHPPPSRPGYSSPILFCLNLDLWAELRAFAKNASSLGRFSQVATQFDELSVALPLSPSDSGVGTRRVICLIGEATKSSTALHIGRLESHGRAAPQRGDGRSHSNAD